MKRKTMPAFRSISFYLAAFENFYPYKIYDNNDVRAVRIIRRSFGSIIFSVENTDEFIIAVNKRMNNK